MSDGIKFASNRIKLTNTAVERLKFPHGAVTRTGKALTQAIWWDTSLKGLGVRLTLSGNAKTYVLQRRVRGSTQERNISLKQHGDPVRLPNGELRDFPYGADDARREAQKLLAHFIDGIDPIEEQRRKEAERIEREQKDKALNSTLQQMLDHYLEHKRTKHGPLRPATKDDMRRTIEANLSEWLDKPIAAVTRDRCLARFVELSKGGKSAANLTMVYLRSICNHAAHVHADEEGNFTILATNPVSRMLKIQKLNREKPRTRRIPLDRLGQAWLSLTRLRAAAKPTADRTRVDLVSLRFLTALRLTESGSLRWSQIDLDKKVIKLSGDVGKTHQDMLLPMSDALFTILDERSKLPRKSPNAREYVFPSPNESGKLPWMKDPNATMKILSAAVGHTISAHDFRRTLEDVAKACKVDPDDRRKLLVHLAGDVHGAHYDNSLDPEMLRPAVNAIAKYIVDASVVAEQMEAGTNVIPFPTKATA